MTQIIFLPHEEICPEGAVIDVEPGVTICDAALANGIDIERETLEELLTVNIDQWRDEMSSILDYLQGYGERLPGELVRQQKLVADALDDKLAKAS